MPFSEACALGIEKCTELVSRARKTTHRLKLLSDTLSKLSTAMRTEFEEAQANYKAVSKLHGLVSLPNELLARIFGYVVNRDDSESFRLTTEGSRLQVLGPGDMGFFDPITTSKRSKAAVTLSYVCRYFRDTATSCARLWTNVSNNKDMTALCLERSKQVPLNAHIFIGRGEQDSNSGSYALAPDELLQTILPHSERLGGLEIDFVTEFDFEEVNGGDPNISKAFHELDAPSLHSLRIRRQINPFGERTNILTNHEFDGWNTPSLRHLVTMHYFPLGLSGLNNLQSLDITLSLGEVIMVDIIQVLSQMTSLIDLRLMIEGIKDHPRQIPKFEKAYLPSIRQLQIGVNGTGKIPLLSSKTVLKAFFSSLFFPSVTDIHLNFMSFMNWEDPRDVSLNRELSWLIQDEKQYLSVERLCLEAIDHNRAKIGRLGIDIPLVKFPNIKELTLCSNSRLLPSLHHGEDLESNLVLEKITIKAIEEGIKTIGSFVATVMEGQKERGEWESFRELVVVNTRQVSFGELGKEYATRIYEGDAAIHWYANGNPEMYVFLISCIMVTSCLQFLSVQPNFRLKCQVSLLR